MCGRAPRRKHAHQLTTLAQSRQEMGRLAAAGVLVDRIAVNANPSPSGRYLLETSLASEDQAEESGYGRRSRHYCYR